MTERFFIVGDIHGCAKELDGLLNALGLCPRDRIVFLGDYIDRGPDAKEVIDRLLALQGQCQPIFLKGNHEDMFLDFLGYNGHCGDVFFWNGGGATLESYGLSPTIEGREAAAALPARHLGFLCALKPYYATGRILCVHAGVDPRLPLAQQREEGEEGLLWIRKPFIDRPHNLPYTVVFGHTPQKEDVLFDLPYKIGIDTGLVYGPKVYAGKLSCLEMTEKKLFQVAKGSRSVELRDVSREWHDKDRARPKRSLQT